MIKQLTIKTKFPTLNQYIASMNRNRYIGNAMKQKYTQITALTSIANDFKLDNIKYDVEITWFVTNFKSDPDNIAFGIKFILDGLVKSKAIKNDGHKNIGSITHNFEKSEEDYSVIKLTPVK